MEEVYTRPQAGQPDELDSFLTALQDLFANPGRRPPGKLILGFRKEWLADIEKPLENHRLPRTRLFLERLERKGIVEAIVGPARSPRLQNFGLAVAEALPGLIADDLLEDRDSLIAPTLQILLTKMWERAKAKDYDRPQFELELYQSLKREGLLLKNFLEQQLKALAGWREEVLTSGLALDLLAFHTTPQGTAEQRSQARLLETYAHCRDDIKPIVQQCEDLYLLVDPSKNQPGQPKASRLAHDALAPLVRARFDESELPGQRARRILESRIASSKDGQGRAPLDEHNLAVVETGRAGMRAWTKVEEQLVETSRQERDRQARNRWGIRIAFGVAGLLILLFAVVAGRQWTLSEERLAEIGNKTTAEAIARTEADRQATEVAKEVVVRQTAQANEASAAVTAVARQIEAEHQASIARSRQLAAQAKEAVGGADYSQALLLAVEAGRVTDTIQAFSVLQQTYPRLARPQLILIGHTGPVLAAQWNQDESLILTRSGNTVRVWQATMTGLLQTACQRAIRNMTWAEWQQFMSGPYRPTCPDAPIPSEAIEAIIGEAKALAQQSQLAEAQARFEELAGWLKKNGQYSQYGAELDAWLESLRAGENPFAITN